MAAAAGAPGAEALAADPYEQLRFARQAMEESNEAECGPAIPLPVVVDVDADGVPAGCMRPAPARPSSSTCTAAAGVTAASRRSTGSAGGSPTGPAARSCRWITGWPRSTSFPAGLEDVETVLAFVRKEGAGLGVDPSRLAIGGDSAGAQLATVAARRQRDAATRSTTRC